MKTSLLIGFLSIASIAALTADDNAAHETTDYAIRKAIKTNNPEELRFVIQRPFTNAMDAVFTQEKRAAYLALAQASIKKITDKTLHTKEYMDKTQEAITTFLSMNTINEWLIKAIRKEQDIAEELKKRTQEFEKKAHNSTKALFESIKQQAPGALEKAQGLLEKARKTSGALNKVPGVLIDIYDEQINKLHDLSTTLSHSYECLSIVKNMKTPSPVNEPKPATTEQAALKIETTTKEIAVEKA